MLGSVKPIQRLPQEVGASQCTPEKLYFDKFLKVGFWHWHLLWRVSGDASFALKGYKALLYMVHLDIPSALIALVKPREVLMGIHSTPLF